MLGCLRNIISHISIVNIGNKGILKVDFYDLIKLFPHLYQDLMHDPCNQNT